MVALNDYAAEVPVSDTAEHPLSLATRIDGAALAVRDKGPAFLIYAFDVAPELYNEKHFVRSVRQTVRMDVFRP